ncbi:MAG: LptF/LptG family permease [Saprospiraceae bacterium]|nr:LptF/LptG family permease [Saprospiraceae bacterium]MBK8111304.1 LptF/LptG family permease [Saprospiraceae bacterium]MBK8852114.1 LptF/LptG family permease [Saprospiraceae bacterium]MBK9689460.1 LptF/LptG family permease [Saprospiraceae bacterium]
MKKLDKFILKSFIGPYVLSFFIAEFVLVMQFLWKYIDDILGKGFSVFDIMELVMYYAASITPMALPISILLSSVMVYGDISEKYELSSMKSAGISLLRVMRPAIFLAVGTAMFSVFASNYIKPVSTFQFKKRFDLIRKQKSTLAIEEGIFNNEFRDIIIRVGSKAKNDKDVKDVIIYDHSLPDKSLLNMIKADSAEMYATPDGHYFVMNLKKGQQYQELDRNRKDNGHMAYPLVRTNFEHWSKVIDMSNFYLSESDLNISRNREDMLNTFQLLKQIDTINLNIKTHREKAIQSQLGFEGKAMLEEAAYQNQRATETTLAKARFQQIKPQLKNAKPPRVVKAVPGVSTENAYLLYKQKLDRIKKGQVQKIQATNPIGMPQVPGRDSSSNFRRLPGYDITKVKAFYETFDSITRNNIAMRSIPAITSNMDLANAAFYNVDNAIHQKQIYVLRLGHQYSFALVCILFLFIGAPLGSIIRKGGYGYPLLVAILFYMLFIISTIVGEKLVRSETFPGWFGAWLPCLLLLPFGLYFTYQALNDARFSWIDKVEQVLLRLFKPFVTSSR